MKQKINISTALIISVAIFIIIIVVTKLFKLEDLPIQTTGVLFGGVLTALITYYLLLGQTQAEEVKEKNVRVFEEKSERYNAFINKLWDIWDDRMVSLEELNELIKIVSKDIVLYTKPKTVDKILEHLIKIAEQAKPDKTNKDEQTTKLIQKNIFDIINELAIEIDLGGEINPEIRNKLNLLEDKVVPYLIQKDFKKLYIEDLKQKLVESEEISITSVEIIKNNIMCRVMDSNVYFEIGPIERNKESWPHLGIFVEYYKNPNYRKYRDAVKGPRKDFLKNSIWNVTSEFLNFNDYDNVKIEFNKLKDNESYENLIAKKIIESYTKWKSFDNKNLEEVISECENNNK